MFHDKIRRCHKSVLNQGWYPIWRFNRVSLEGLIYPDVTRFVLSGPTLRWISVRIIGQALSRHGACRLFFGQVILLRAEAEVVAPRNNPLTSLPFERVNVTRTVANLFYCPGYIFNDSRGQTTQFYCQLGCALFHSHIHILVFIGMHYRRSGTAGSFFM